MLFPAALACMTVLHASSTISTAHLRPGQTLLHESAHGEVAAEGRAGHAHDDVAAPLGAAAAVQLPHPAVLQAQAPQLPAHAHHAAPPSHAKPLADGVLHSLPEPAEHRRDNQDGCLSHAVGFAGTAPRRMRLDWVAKCRPHGQMGFSATCGLREEESAGKVRAPQAAADEVEQEGDHEIAVYGRVAGGHVLQVKVQVAGPPLAHHLLACQWPCEPLKETSSCSIIAHNNHLRMQAIWPSVRQSQPCLLCSTICG